MSPYASRLALGLPLVMVVPLGAAAGADLLAQQPPPSQAPQQLLLLSYALTKGAYDKILPLFAADWKKKTGQTVAITGSYGGSGSQTRAVIGGRLGEARLAEGTAQQFHCRQLHHCLLHPQGEPKEDQDLEGSGAQ
ncbi:MAG: hypothetical protein WCK64_08315 [Synechococcaceae cyanobacterium ELA445]